MKKLSITILLICMLFLNHVCFAEYVYPLSPEYKYDDIRVYGRISNIKEPLYKINNKVYYPLRCICEYLGFKVDFIDTNGTILISKTTDKLFPYDEENGFDGYKNFYGEVVIPAI